MIDKNLEQNIRDFITEIMINNKDFELSLKRDSGGMRLEVILGHSDKYIIPFPAKRSRGNNSGKA